MLKSVNLARYICVICGILSVVITTGCDDDSTETGGTAAEAPAMTPDELAERSLRFQNGRAFGINYGIESEPITTLVIGENKSDDAASAFTLVSGAFTASGVVSWLGRKAPYFFNVQESTFPSEFGPISLSEFQARIFRQGSDGFYATNQNKSVRSNNVEGDFKRCRVISNTETDAKATEARRLESQDCLFIHSFVDLETTDDGGLILRELFDMPLAKSEQVLQYVLHSTVDVDILNPASGTNIKPNSSTLADLFTIARGGSGIIADDSDIFRVKLPESGVLTVRTVGFLRTHMRLLDPSGQIIASNGSSLANTNAEISAMLSEGTYLVQVEKLRTLRSDFIDAIGPYILQSTFAPQEISGNLIVSSDTDMTQTPISAGSQSSERIVLSNSQPVINSAIVPQQNFDNAKAFSPGEDFPVILAAPNFEETLRFDLPSEGILLIHIVPGARLTLFDGSRIEVPRKSLEIFRNVIHRFFSSDQASTYYLHVSGTSSGTYNISTRFIESIIDANAQEQGSPFKFKEDSPVREYYVVATLPELMDRLLFGGFVTSSTRSRGGPVCRNVSGFSPKVCTRGLVSLDQNNPLPSRITTRIDRTPASGGGDYILEVFSSPISHVNISACADSNNMVPEIASDDNGNLDGSNAQLIEREIEVESCLRIAGISNNDSDNDIYILNFADDVDAVTFSATHSQPSGSMSLYILDSVSNTVINSCFPNDPATRTNCTVALPQDARQLFARVATISGTEVGNYTLDVLPSRLLNQESFPIPLPR